MNDITRVDYNALVARLDAIGVSISGNDYHERVKRILHMIMSDDNRSELTDSGLWHFAQWVASNSVGRINALALAVASGMGWEEANAHVAKLTTVKSQFLGPARVELLSMVDAIALLRAARKTADADTGKAIDTFLRQS